MMNNKICHAFAMLIALGLFEMGRNAYSGEPDPATPAPALKNAGKPVTEAEATKFAKELATAVKTQDTEAVNRIIRLDSMAERIVSDVKVTEVQRRGFMKGFNQALRQGVFTQQIVGVAEAGGTYDLLRIHTVNGRACPLFRMIGADGALNYHEYTLVHHQDGTIEIEDIYFYITGEPVSQSMRRMVLPLLTSQNFMKANDRKELKALTTFSNMAKSVREGEYQAAADAYHTLPKGNQEQKPVLILYLIAVANLGEESEPLYLAAMEKFRKLYPNDAALDLISIDYYYLKGQINKGIKAVQRLDKVVGGDPYLDMFQGNLLMELKQYDKARKAIEKCIKEEPTLELAYWSRITLSLAEKNHVDTLKWLKTTVKTFKSDVGGFDEIPEYSEFVKSPQFAEFEKWYAERGLNPGCR